MMTEFRIQNLFNFLFIELLYKSCVTIVLHLLQ